jgi:aminopeptidase N
MTVRLALSGAVVATLLATAVPVASAQAPAAPSAPASQTHDHLAGANSRLHRDTTYPAHGGTVVDALHYGLRLAWAPATTTLTGHETLTFRAARDAQHFSVELIDSLVVSSATLNGTPTVPAQINDHVSFGVPVQRGSRYVLRLTYAGVPHPVSAPTHRTDFSTVGFTPMPDGSAWTMQEPFGAYTWYAVNDTPADKAFYDVTVTTPHGMVGVANGELRSRTRVGGSTVTRWHLASPASSYLTTLAIGDYVHHVRHGVKGLPIDLWTHRGNTRELKVLGYAPTAVRFLQQQVGRYPFATLGIVAVPSASAMETQTMVTMGTRGGVLNRDNVVHEIAHQWYGDTVTPRDWSDVWMNEGMALYLAEIRWTAHANHISASSILAQYNLFFARGSRHDFGPPAAYDPTDFGELNVYVIPALMWDMLRQRVGTTRFDHLIRAWPAAHRHASSSRAQLIGWWSRHTHLNLHPFFHRWLLAKKEPAWHAG